MPMLSAYNRQTGYQFPRTVIASSQYASGTPMGINTPMQANAGISGTSSLNATGSIGLGLLITMIVGIAAFYYLTRGRQF